jgi:hypothetical protein
MPEDDDAEILAAMEAALQKSRGYGDFFSFPPDRDLEEAGVAFYSALKSRGRPNDPPDCEGVDANGSRVAIEVTELVDGAAIRAAKTTGHMCEFREWTKADFLREISLRINAKDRRYPHLKEPPYPGGYVVVIHTDEAMLSRSAVQAYLENHRFPKPQHVSRALLVLSYDPAIQRSPYFELAVNG